MTITYAQAVTVHEQADLLISGAQIAASIETLASEITDAMAEDMPLVLCVLNGGMIPMAQLLLKLQFPLETDYLHATRYGNKTVGTNLSWLARPSIDFKGRTVLVVDDIFDEGHTLAAICEYLEEAGAAKVYAAALLNKVHDRKVAYRPDFVGLDVEDRFVYGFGMDYQGYFRNAEGIYAVKGM
ncbi:MAG TPA: hypoxanthine-guanine phosphoribosyltransferase [Oceanospirillaceae bacterium]|nr:hypoxanthine-guanine phosphoribosyltransferase [Oceanospirillaceae bacterium]